MLRAVRRQAEDDGVYYQYKHEPADTDIFPQMETIPEMEEPPEDEEEPNVDDIDAELAPEEPPEAEFWPTPQQLADIEKAHNNCGHPDNAKFARYLRLGNCRVSVCRWVRKHFRCQGCEANRPPDSRKPVAVSKTYRANHVVGIDTVFVSNPVNKTLEPWLNCICWGTSFQQVGRYDPIP